MAFCMEARSEEHTSELQSHVNLVCRLLLEKKKGRGAKAEMKLNLRMFDRGTNPSAGLKFPSICFQSASTFQRSPGTVTPRPKELLRLSSWTLAAVSA